MALKKKRKASSYPERTLQKQCVYWLKLQFPHVLCHHSPNGGRRDAREGRHFKEMGTEAGFPDLFVALARPGHGYFGLFVEFKWGKGKLTTKQQDVIQRLTQAGYLVRVITNFEDFKKLIEWYILGLKEEE